MKISKFLAGAALVFSSAVAYATPFTYTGGVTSDTGFNKSNMSTAGFYLWNNEADSSQWHLRWTGVDAPTNPVFWAGALSFKHSSLGTVTKFKFERRDSLSVYEDVPILAGSDVISWTSFTDNKGGIDGFDFTIDGDTELMDFSLGSNLFGDVETGESQNIFIGGDMASTNMYTTSFNGLTFQNFSIGVAVPEPGSLLLLGVGLIGLGLSRRRCA